MPQPTDSDRAKGFQGAWVSNARIWSVTTKRLVNSVDAGEARLAVVALCLCLNNAWLLVQGKRGISPDGEARSDCPLALDELKRQRDRLERFRDEVLHLSDMTETGHGIVASWTRQTPYFVHTSSVNSDRRRRGTFTEDSISRTEIEGLQEQLDPWLARHHRRWISEWRMQAATDESDAEEEADS
jgi:hypothetical protein